MKYYLSFFIGVFLTMLGLMSFKYSTVQDWPVPPKYDKMVNPVKSDPTSLADGKALWGTHCKSCHGKLGLGDGTKAAQLKTEPGNFTLAKFQKQSDGAIFYKTMEGKEDMPKFKNKIPDQNDIWSIVNYIRTFAK